MRKWTSYEIEYLKDNHQKMTDKEIGGVLERTDKAVRSKRNELKLMKKKGLRWTDEEKELLKRYVKEGLTNIEISKLLGRSYKTVTKVKGEMGLSEKRGVPRRWTEEEEDELIEMYYDGYSDKEIADALNRTESAIAMRRNDLRLVSWEVQGSRNQNIYAVYKKDEFLAEGTLLEIADELGVTLSMMKWYEWRSRHDKNTETVVIRID